MTSLPNAVAAVHLVARGRGAATFSTALNSNTLNVALGLVLPATVIGLGRPSSQATLITAWYIGLTAVTLAFAYRGRGIGRGTGTAIIAAYGLFTGCVLVTAHETAWTAAIAASAAAATGFGIWLAFSCRRPGFGDSGPGPGSLLPAARQFGDQGGVSMADVPVNGSSPAQGRSLIPARSSPQKMRKAALVPGWPVRRLCILGLELPVGVAVVDVALGHRVILIGLLIAGPCCVLLTGRWKPTGLTELWVTGLAVVLGVPDGIWGTSIHLVFLAAVAAVALAATLAAGFIQARIPPGRKQ